MPQSVIVFYLLYIGGLASTIIIDACWGIYLYQLHYFWNPPIRWWYSYLPDLSYAFIIAVAILIGFIIHFQNISDNG